MADIGTRADLPDREEIRLRIIDEHVDLTRWVSYDVQSDFLTPSDAWHFTVADEDLPKAQRDALKCGARVGLFINGIQVMDGHIDTVEVSASRTGGWQWTIAGRDRLGHAVDATADPQLEFKEGATLADVLKTVFTPFGWVDDDHFLIDNSANRNATTGADRGTKSSRSKRHFGRELPSIAVHRLKPHNHEGVFAFASRVTQRFGLWIWATNDGEKLVVSKPDFEQNPTYQLRRRTDGSGNVIDGAVRFDAADQPAIIVADGFSGGGEFGKGRIKSYAVNPYFGVDKDGFVLDEVQAIISKFPEAKQVTFTTQPFTRRISQVTARPMYLHDDESKTQEQIDNYVRRELSLLARKALTASYTIEGHGQLISDALTLWGIDTVVDVQDDVADLHERMYVLGLGFSKSRSGGTHTTVHLVRLNSIQF